MTHELLAVQPCVGGLLQFFRIKTRDCIRQRIIHAIKGVPEK